MKTQPIFSSKSLDFYIKKYLKSLQFHEQKDLNNNNDKLIKILLLDFREKFNKKGLTKQENQKKKKNINYVNELMNEIGIKKAYDILELDCYMDKMVGVLLLEGNRQGKQKYNEQNNKQSENLVNYICLQSVNSPELDEKLNIYSKTQLKSYLHQQFPLILLSDRNGQNFLDNNNNKLKLTNKVRNTKQLNEIFFDKNNNLLKSFQKIIQKQSGKLNLNYYDSLMWKHNVKLERMLRKEEQRIKQNIRMNKNQKQTKQQQQQQQIKQVQNLSQTKQHINQPIITLQQQKIISKNSQKFQQHSPQTQLQKISQSLLQSSYKQNNNMYKNNNFIGICIFMLILLLAMVLFVKLRWVFKFKKELLNGQINNNGSDCRIKIEEGTSLLVEN